MEAMVMKTIIIYATKTGTAKRCASLLAANLGVENTDLFDIADGEPDYSGYDMIVFGTPVRGGVIDDRIKRMIEKHAADLRQRRYAVFTCNCLLAKVSDAFIKNFSEDFMEHALCMDTFGGEFDPESQHGIAKFFTKMMERALKSDPKPLLCSHILPENIANFAAEISRERVV
jgi:menaquinone-dependent protoporphyrinogen oxidase